MVTADPSISVASLLTGRQLTSSNLIKSIFELDQPEVAVRSLPAQSIYMALRHQGLGSGSELIALVTSEQLQLLLDFDIWDKDELCEERLWEWLEVTDAEGDLDILQKILKSLDLKIVAMLINRYVEVIVPENRNDAPPGEGFYSPDQGQTWLSIKLDDGRKHFLLGRLLALVFETSHELFYQLISIPSIQTSTILEEEAYQDRCRRLNSEGIPNLEDAAAVQSPIGQSEFIALFNGKSTERPVLLGIQPVSPLISTSDNLQPLSNLFAELSDISDAAQELTFIMNTAVVRFNIELCETEQVTFLSEKIIGALNIGLELAEQLLKSSPLDIYKKIGLRPLYRLGLNELFLLRHAAKQEIQSLGEKIKDIPAERFSLIAHTSEIFPVYPKFMKLGANKELALESGTAELTSGSNAFRYLASVTSAKLLIVQ